MEPCLPCISASREKTEGQRVCVWGGDNEDDVRKTRMRAGGEGINENRKKRKGEKR